MTDPSPDLLQFIYNRVIPNLVHVNVLNYGFASVSGWFMDESATSEEELIAGHSWKDPRQHHQCSAAEAHLVSASPLSFCTEIKHIFL